MKQQEGLSLIVKMALNAEQQEKSQFQVLERNASESTMTVTATIMTATTIIVVAAVAIIIVNVTTTVIVLTIATLIVAALMILAMLLKSNVRRFMEWLASHQTQEFHWTMHTGGTIGTVTKINVLTAVSMHGGTNVWV